MNLKSETLNLKPDFMHDFKNISLAWLCSAFSFFAAIESGTLITVVSAIILPILFFTIGKTVDVLLQIYFQNRREANGQKSER